MTIRKLIFALPLASLPLTAQPGTASRIADAAVRRVGDPATLGRIQQAHFETTTLWHTLGFGSTPFAPVSGYERGTELRDYKASAWRHVRRAVTPRPVPVEYVDVVSDSVAMRILPGPPGAPRRPMALNATYLHERLEVFTFSPERLLPLVASASDLTRIQDTTMDGTRHLRLRATVERFPTTILLRASDTTLVSARYISAHLDDFGLAQYGTMEVEVWFSSWRRTPLTGTSGIEYPSQWDIRRAGQPYKRITVLQARFDPAIAADSFRVDDGVRSVWKQEASRAMWDVTYDSARIVDSAWAQFGAPFYTTGAIKVGGMWVLLEGGLVPARLASDLAWLATADPGARVGGLLASVSGAPSGGMVEALRRRVPVWAGVGTRRGAQAVLAGWNESNRLQQIGFVQSGRWTRVGTDSVWIEPVDFPGIGTGLVMWVPTRKWLYSGRGATPTERSVLVALSQRRGWDVSRYASAGNVTGR